MESRTGDQAQRIDPEEAGKAGSHQSGRMGTLLVVRIVPDCCGMTLAQPQCHQQHDTKMDP